MEADLRPDLLRGEAANLPFELAKLARSVRSRSEERWKEDFQLNSGGPSTALESKGRTIGVSHFGGLPMVRHKSLDVCVGHSTSDMRESLLMFLQVVIN